MSVDDILLPPEVAQRLRVGKSTLSNWRVAGVGPKWFRMGAKKVAYLSSDVEAYIKRQAELAADEQGRRSA